MPSVTLTDLLMMTDNIMLRATSLKGMPTALAIVLLSMPDRVMLWSMVMLQRLMAYNRCLLWTTRINKVRMRRMSWRYNGCCVNNA
mmetsp:Transcript_65976/g.120397  ORF Transcript_65976/g.120397 Transcript_65976/m.120397 type:complete len:86 (-) Transcript_65976:269-526(-)